MLQFDRKITISAAGSRRAATWPTQTLYWSELVQRLETPARGAETWDAYMHLTKAQQDDLKDVGGFVAGSLCNGRRKASAVTGRDVLTLDLDHIAAGATDDVLRRVDGLGCAYAIYSTRKHAPHAPRLRILLPLDRTVTADEYEPIARKAAQMVSIEMCDPSTFEPSRLMYWPSCCADAQYVYTYGDKPFLSADGMLEFYTRAGQDWHDITVWPQVPGVADNHKALAARQGNPTEKPGVIGAFCRVYNIYGAMDKFLSGIYVPVDGSDGRYTYAAGSTTGGAIIYDDGAFLFSHHATDPASGRLVNAFDLVRLHLFADKDDEAQPGTPTNRLPSYTAMCERAVQDADVAALINTERYENATRDYKNISGDTAAEPANWMDKLHVNQQTGAPVKTIDNIWIILENDPLLKGRIALDAFAHRGYILDKLPWDKREGRRVWEDSDDDGAYWWMEKTYGISTNPKVDSALSLCGQNHSFNEAKDYLTGLLWDGVARLDTLFIEYLGATDTEYTRAVTRKAFTAAVARIMIPGCKYDTMPILTGPQGLGKSTLLDKMGRSWYNDGMKTFDGKEAYEFIQGLWIAEIGELEAFNKSEVDRIKQFLSQRVDRFRAAYGKRVQDCPRCCVFFGTSNKAEYLSDKTGNRRFWPIDVGATEPQKNVFKDLDDNVDQLWAEAVTRFRLGEPLYLPAELEKAAREEQEAHREYSPREGVIRDFIDQPIPADWSSWSLERRRMFWSGGIVDKDNLPLVRRDRICALEIWCEALESDQRFMKYQDTQEVNGILSMLEGWGKMKNPARFGYCKLQRGYERRRI